MTNATLRFFSGRPILSQFFICSAVILAACLINALSILFDAARYGEGIAPWKPYAQELSSWVGWSVTFMLLLPSDDKVARQGLGVPARLAVYALSSVLFSAIHVVVMAGLRYPAWALAGARYHFDWGFDTLFYEYRKDLLGLFLAAGQAALWRKGSRKKEERVTAPPGAEPAFLVPGRGGEILVRAGEIDWIEAQGNYVALHVRGQERLLRQPLKEIEAKLSDMAFIRTHRSALVNMRRVKGITRTELGESRVEFDNRDSAPLSASRRAEVVRALAAH